jgi:hypothetical protein
MDDTPIPVADYLPETGFFSRMKREGGSMKLENLAATIWQRVIGGGILVVIGLASGLSLKSLKLDWPSDTLIVLGALICFTPIIGLISRVHKVKFKEMEVILDDMVLPPKLRAELSGLSSHDIWALDSFENAHSTLIDSMKPAQRVAARMLVDFKLLSITGEGAERKVSLTSQGR